MKSSAFACLLASFGIAVLACGDTIHSAPDTDRPVADAGPDGAGDASPQDAGKAVPTSCSGPITPVSCPSLEPAPTAAAAVRAFVKEGAIPLRCGEDEAAVWDVRPLVDLYGSQKIFMMGEVHGTNEIGIMSSILLEQLAKKKQVNVLAVELPMDMSELLASWISTGEGGPAVDWLEGLAPNMFGRILPETARELAKAGFPIRFAAIDYAYNSEIPIEAIREIATKLTSQADTVLATLPSAPANPNDANTYFDHIMSSKDAICAELTEADCDRLNAMTHALWVSAFLNNGMDELWFSRREEVIYYNMKQAMRSPTDRMFLHMGAAHTNKYEFSAGSRMTHEYELTNDKVFSEAPAFGDGSVIWYQEPQNLPGEPSTLTSALSDAPANPLFISTTRPSSTCVTNPFGLEPEARTSSGTRAETYDGYIHYGKLTSEESPDQTTFVRDLPIQDETASRRNIAGLGSTFAHFRGVRARVEAKERAALEARAARYARTR
ncbi:MAG: hypothetical protein K0S65_726 [Labilithrix sp.]|nr:hypothetical protein [Labilithrix sp.]